VQSAAARAVQSAYQPAAAQASPLPQLAFEMVRQFNQGQSRFTIRLDPPELGRVEVKMHVDASGAVNARLTVERTETLDLFQRDQRVLERALTQAGLDGNKANLEFALKQNPFSGMAHDQRQQSPQGGSFFAPRANAEDDLAIPAITLYRGAASAGGVNLFV
jgi:flagellar hook-length control protein FliK